MIVFAGSVRCQHQAKEISEDGSDTAERLHQVAVRARLQLFDSAGPRKGASARALQCAGPFSADGLHQRWLRSLLHHGALYETAPLGAPLWIGAPPF